MANTFVAIKKTVLTGTQATVTLDSIPSTYTDLYVIFSARHNGAYSGGSVRVAFNSITSNYSITRLFGTGTSAGGDSYTGQSSGIYYGGGANGSTDVADTFSNADVYIPNYTGSLNKTYAASGVIENTSSTAYIDANAFLMNNTDSISSITFSISGSSFVSGSRFDLYGIKNS